jgi:hypothetical protein
MNTSMFYFSLIMYLLLFLDRATSYLVNEISYRTRNHRDDHNFYNLHKAMV